MQLPVANMGEQDNQFDALAHPARRRMLFALYRERPLGDGSVSVSDETPSTSAAALHHQHIPKLANYGYVTRNPGSDEVVPGANFDEIEMLLDVLAKHWRADPDR